MDPVSAGLAAVSIGSSIAGGLKAKKEAKKAAREQARLTFSRRQREIRNMQKQHELQSDTARAGVYASGLQMGGSSRRYVETLDMENMREVAMARHAARQERKAIRAGAAGVGDSMLFQAAGDAIGFAARMYASQMPGLTDAQVDMELGAEQWDFGE